MKALNEIIKPIVNEDQGYSKHLEMIFSQIYSTDNIEVKTDLSQAQVNAITKALVFADRYKSNILRDIAVKHMQLLISKDRAGRKEFTQIAGSTATSGLDPMTSTFDKLIGR